jgi:guanylate cyclase soluble subunit beta
MYGMVHNAARNMAVDALGNDEWALLLKTYKLSPDQFISNNNYSDAVTFEIVDAISERLGVGTNDLLRAFGRYWIEYAATSPFGVMFRVGGQDIRSFLRNLNRMHASIHATMPGSRMPSFEVLLETNSRIDVLYVSERIGLEAFVEGLFSGLLHHFGENGEVAHLESRTDGDVFSILLSGPRAAA